MGCLVDAQLAQQPEFPAALVAAKQILRVFLLSLPQLVGEQVLLQRLGLVEALVAGRAREGLNVRGDVVLELVFLVETFVAELAEEALFFVQLPPSFPLLLLQFFFSLRCVEHKLCVQVCKKSSFFLQHSSKDLTLATRVHRKALVFHLYFLESMSSCQWNKTLHYTRLIKL